MPFSTYLESKRGEMRELVGELSRTFSYVSILGTDVKANGVMANRQSSAMSEGYATECGFVIKMNDGRAFFEYSTDDISGDKHALAEKILASIEISPRLADDMITVGEIGDEKLVKSFSRECDFDAYKPAELIAYAEGIKDKLLALDEHVVNAYCSLNFFTTSKLFISANKELDQFYSWVNAMAMVVYRDHDKMVQAHDGTYSNLMREAIEALPGKLEGLVAKANKLTTAKPITPGVYDCITDPSITGLIAHEAFGHGVEMDQFVKDRALAKQYVGKYVASPICNMRDGAASAFSTASYFFDDDGVLAHDTQIIKDGILVSGISDLTSASELGCEPTGNGRRQSFKRKAYSRMTNTFFEKGTDKLEDMIASVKHGYMLFETDNGMEDPKNWQIQCTAQYGIEIVDGKLTDNYVAPVVMSGYVPDVLKSISMVSDDFRVIGAGSCGKGYKEWVRVSDGGPALKVKVKLA